ncbi:bifunctional methylenetetrahydrofolate dehydrogenase/methenyltetrahydrofolate cyclohydrolase FolD [Marinobacterium arenosum]|uniref:bifunctional methylenetetrahydrofolate dehydrogenase/methenyltetrahydrofolate cyclohydrolase FolD n=1 Tax=Marinobacterium arenosum TaxID=2862496 RepID=UPI001C940473|nr:bifunctional methylenetetrahydrofolate dehydrogenase/methenyltetrahydrofolate cyclohydrolase FolD [Marinobacterium arenosum]MBY4677202.1 bifunctional methylenetetrahydrofolate dehydrogenase/methenyltetrahydrofolate cyclohydrolase FolD [Marinobacterium arenosum]
MKTVLSSSTEPCTTVIDGRAVADELLASIRNRVEQESLKPGLAVILVGSDPASSVYVRNKGRSAEACGFLSRQYDLPETASESELLQLIERLNADAEIHGILVQLPLPRQIDQHRVIQAIDPAKDVDGFHYLNVGLLAAGNRDTSLVPCTPLGCLHLIRQQLGDSLSGKHAVVIGRSNIVGKPMANLLLQADCTVSMLHSRSRDPEQLCRQADIVVAAVGIPGLVNSNWIKPGAVVIDVGINRVDQPDGRSRLVGDVDYDDVYPLASAITPVPGGVGPMTIAMLMKNTLDSALRFNNKG